MHCNPLLGSLILPPFPSWPIFPMSLSCLPASGLRLILPFIIRDDEWHSRISCLSGVVFGKHRPWLWLAALPDTICCLSVINYRYCVHGIRPSPTTLHCRYPMMARLLDTREPILGSRNKSLLVCLIPAEDKDNTDSNKKHLVSVWSDRAQTFSPVWLFVISWTEKPAMDWSLSGFSVHGILLLEY